MAQRDDSERILEEIEDREWDRVLSSPEGLANAERESAETMQAIATGDIIEYIPGKSLNGSLTQRLSSEI